MFDRIGVGCRLLDAAFARINVQQFIENLYLTVRADNTAACRLYQSKRFEAFATSQRDSKVGSEYCDGVMM